MQTIRAAAPSSTRTGPRWAFLRWLPTFLAFPLGGLVAEIVGPVDSVVAAIVGGLVTGAILGAAQSWGLGRVGPATVRWVLATAGGLAVGLGVGAAAVGYGTATGDLAVQGVICGMVVGAAQAVTLRSSLGGLAVAWPPVLGALWALGWTVTATIGVDVEARYTVFGSSGALTVTVLSAVLPVVLTIRSERGPS